VSIFKACDVRGEVGRELTPAIAERLGRAIGSALEGGPVVVGGDVRLSTEALRGALVDGLTSSGCRVVDVGVVPTPAFYFARDYLRIQGGVMVTGSHNPPGDNGFKICLSSMPITEEELADLERRMAAGGFRRGAGSTERREVIAAYQAQVERGFASRDGLKVVVDAGNGCYGPIAPASLRRLGYEVVELFCEPDGRFPNRPPNPAVAANLSALRETVLRAGAHLGAAFDGDGDRVVFVDERGRVVTSDVAIVLFVRHLLRERPGDVVYDAKCSSVVAEEVRQAGGVPVMEKSGHAFIKATLLRRRAVLGGEISGHYFFGTLGRDDGLYALLLMLRIVSEAGRGLAALADSVPHYPITPDIRLPCKAQEARAIIDELTQAFAGEPDCEVSTLDGVRIAWADGWALARTSVTEPLLTLRFEGHTQARLNEVMALVAGRSARLAALLARFPQQLPVSEGEGEE